MVRSWDARVRGAAGKVTALDTEQTPEPERLSLADPGIGADNDAAPSLGAASVGLLVALGTIVDTGRVACIVVDRFSGEVLWRSERWIERFGVKSHLGRHHQSSTELGEIPLPPADETWHRKTSLVRSDGTPEVSELTLVSTPGPAGTPYVSVIAADQPSNRPIINDRSEVCGIIGGAIEVGTGRSHEIAVLYVDLDRFKVVHDLVGNLETIRLLDLVRRCIRAAVRPSDLVLRLPSDEFVVVLSDLDRVSTAERVADEVRVAIATLSDVGHEVALTASVGVALSEPGQDGDSLLSAAETAVYLAKGRGRNRVAVHDEELRARSERLLVVERQLRRSIDRREVKFAYQPVVEMNSGEVVGAEALLRLGGDVGLSAVEVIQAAENSGLMGALGALVLDGVDEQLSTLIRDRSDAFQVMINVSEAQLDDEYLLESLVRLASDSTIKPGRLSIEVPEAVAISNPEAVVRLAELIRPHFRLGIDGFGTMVASTALLESLPLDYIKLHRSITASATSMANRQRVAELVQAARSLDIQTVALGVESREQVDALRSVGCRQAQGFLYVGAVAATDLLDLIGVGFERAESL